MSEIERREPSTEAGKGLLEWAQRAYAGQDQLNIWHAHILDIENQSMWEAWTDIISRLYIAETKAIDAEEADR